MSKTYSAGIVTAYGAAKRAGYQGTYEDFCRQQAGYAESAATVEQAKNTAVSAASTATAKAGEAATAATAAQTAKTQTEAAASQALADIGTARTAAISAVQTEGATQTANATAQAQAAATSATTARTKASEASASATTATTKATEAAASATSAASSASAAQGVLESIPSDYSQMSADVEQLQADLTDVNNTFKFNTLNNRVIDDVILNSNDKWSSLSGYKFYIFQIAPLSTISFQTNTANSGYYCFLKSNSVVVGNSADLATNSHRTEVPANTTITFTAPNDANYIYVAIGTDTTPRTPASVLLDNNYDLLKTYQYNINNIFAHAKDYIDTLIKNSNTFTGDSSGGYHFKYTLYNGHFYLFENNSQSGTANVISRATVNGSNIQIFVTQLAYGTHKIVKCTADAAYLYVYTTAVPELFVKDLGSVDETVKLFQSGIVIAADGSGDFSTLRDGIDFATQIPNCMVYVKDGIYDLTTEFAAEISASRTTQYGIALKSGVHIVFSSGAEVTAIYEGNDEHVTTYFAPFYADEAGGGFTLENLSIKAKNTRYCVHDELNGVDVKAINKYINCRMIFDNTTAPTPNYPQCIGGGFAKNTYVEIDGCYFKSKRAELQKTPLVSYHNTNYSANALSYVSLKNCYFDDTYSVFRMLYHGASTEVSIAYVSGNSFGGAPEVIATSGSSTEINVAIVEWNNTIRT